MSRRRVLRAVLAALVAGVLLAPAVANAATLYSIESLSMGFVLDATGAGVVTETRTIATRDLFDYFYWYFDGGSYDSFEVLGVARGNGTPYTRTYDPNSKNTQPIGTYYVETDDDTVYVYVYRPVNYATETYVLTYRIGGLVRRYTDGALFTDWYVGNWGTPTKTFTGSVTPPAPVAPAGMIARTSGLPAANTTVDANGVVAVTGADIPHTTAVKGRVSYPASAFAGLPLRVAAASIARSPSGANLSYRRRSGVARYTLKATLKGPAGYPMASQRLLLQSSTNGRTGWKTVATLKTNSKGQASKSFKVTKARTVYYRWYSPGRSGAYLKVATSKQKVTVR